MADSSFDVVSKVDRQEVDNALQPGGEGAVARASTSATPARRIEWSGEESIVITADTEERVKAALDVFKEKLIRRDISLKAFDAGEPAQSGKIYKLTGTLVQGISQREREEDHEEHPRRGPQGRQGADPGRRAAGEQQEA